MARSPRSPIARASASTAGVSDPAADPNLRWMGALVFFTAAALTGLLVALVPPTEAGQWGWAVAGAAIAGRVLTAAWLASGTGPVHLRVLYGADLLGVAGLCTLQFLAAEEAFYHDLVLIDLLYIAAVQPPRRAALAVLLAVGGMVPSLALARDATVSVAEWGAEAILWSLVAGLVLIYTATSRRQRVELHRTGSRAEALARVDALTGLGNRRAFDEMLDREFGQARRYGTPLSLIVGDLDSFKAVNDRHGHAAGDEVLRQIAGRMIETVRLPDVCFRWGGDEFAVVLPQTGRPEAAVVAARISAVAGARVHAPDGSPVTVSLGVAELGRHEGEPVDLLIAADAALLAVKAGRLEPMDASGGVRRIEPL